MLTTVPNGMLPAASCLKLWKEYQREKEGESALFMSKNGQERTERLTKTTERPMKPQRREQTS